MLTFIPFIILLLSICEALDPVKNCEGFAGYFLCVNETTFIQ